MTDPGTPAKVVPQFESLVGQSGIHIHDPVEDVQAMLFTDESVQPEPTSPDGFVYPVDSATEIRVAKLQTPFLIDIWVRDGGGNIIEEINPESSRKELPPDNYLLEFAGMGMKIYARVKDTGFTIEPSKDRISIEFDSEEEIKIGARSIHLHPARTLQTSDDPVDLMRVVSLFGNAMKTWSAERTFPSLRGHPPLVEIGDECRIPDELKPPDTGIKITIPPEHEWLYPVTPLAYWLGGTVRPGTPALELSGEKYPLGVEGGYKADSDQEAFEQHVRDILQFTFLLDCAVRTEGFYNIELDARRRVEAVDLSLDFERLYNASLAERVQTYLDMDCTFESLATRIGRPGWRLTADMQASPEQATILPFLARDLAVVRCPSQARLELSSEDATKQMDGVFARSSQGKKFSSSRENIAGALSTSSLMRSSQTRTSDRIIGLPKTDSMSQAWIGQGFAIGAAKASTKSYLQRLEKHAEGKSGINIDVVVNDEEMADEASVSNIYGTRDHLAFDIDLHRELTTESLAGVFESKTDFVHYIGHVDPEGFDCVDGYLDANQLGNVGADTFVLNACASYEQGQRLVDQGAIAGVVTLEDVINSLATKVGKSVARLLNYGFPIGSATGLIQETIFTGSNYVVVGDSNAALAQSNVPVPNVARISLRGDGRFDVGIETFASWNYDVGSIYRPYIEGCDCHYVVPGMLDTWPVDEEALDDFLGISTFPVVGQGNLYWSDEVSASELRERLQSYA